MECYTCKKHTEKLYQCGNQCGTLYCGQECQELDWIGNHFNLCLIEGGGKGKRSRAEGKGEEGEDALREAEQAREQAYRETEFFRLAQAEFPRILNWYIENKNRLDQNYKNNRALFLEEIIDDKIAEFIRNYKLTKQALLMLVEGNSSARLELHDDNWFWYIIGLHYRDLLPYDDFDQDVNYWTIIMSKSAPRPRLLNFNQFGVCRDVERLITQGMDPDVKDMIFRAHNMDPGIFTYQRNEKWMIQQASLGYLNLIQWGRAQRPPLNWNSDVCAAAARGGHLELLRWLRLNGCPWSVTTSYAAAQNGHFAVLQWARQNGVPWDTQTSANIAKNGRLEILQWARANGCPWDDRTCAYAASGGHLQVLQWARANGCPWDWFTTSAAAQNGHLTVLQWARANNCEWDETTCHWAAKGGHLHVLQWARANGCPWNESTCANAALGGHLHVLQWARANGCPSDEDVCNFAADSGHLHILQWARANGYPFDVNRVIYNAVRHGHLHILQWISITEPLPLEAIRRDAIAYNRIHIVEWVDTLL